ncbi:hypothetical protein [Geotalea uraniireducens]|nr:hypothetical protein [Geotalea uraniireducens]
MRIYIFMTVFFCSLLLNSHHVTAADRLVVKNSTKTSNAFTATDSGLIGVNVVPRYAVDVANNDGALNSQMHFSANDSDTGGYITSAGENNFFLSSGAAYDANHGWVQKSSDGKAVIVGSGGAGYRIFLSKGNTQGQPIPNLKPTLKIDYDGNMELVGSLKIAPSTAQPACVDTLRGTFWFINGATDTLQVCMKTSRGLAWTTIAQ